MNDLMKQCAASGQMSARQIAEEMAESCVEAPAGELTNEQILAAIAAAPKVSPKYAGWVRDQRILYGRAIITADRQLRASPAVGDVAMPQVGVHCGQATVLEADAQAALTALRASPAVGNVGMPEPAGVVIGFDENGSAIVDHACEGPTPSLKENQAVYSYEQMLEYAQAALAGKDADLDFANHQVKAANAIAEGNGILIDALTAERDALQAEVILKAEYARTTSNAHEAACDERDALRKDAERYRWLRDVHVGNSASSLELISEDDDLGRAIDAAMTKEPK